MQTITSNADSFGNGLISVGLQNRRPLPWMARQAECPRLQAGRCRQPLAVWQRMAPLEKHRYGGACRGRRHAYGHNASFTSMVESFSLSQ